MAVLVKAVELERLSHTGTVFEGQSGTPKFRLQLLAQSYHAGYPESTAHGAVFVAW